MRQHSRAVTVLTATLLSLPLLFTLTPHSLSAADLPLVPQMKQSDAAPANPSVPAAPTTDGSLPLETPSALEQQQPPPSAAATVKPPVFVLNNSDVSSILGEQVHGAANEDMGRIIDIIVDQSGLPRAAVIDFGGFLGVGSRKIAVDWNALHFGQKDGHGTITLELTRDQVKAAPEYQSGKPITVLGALSTLDSSRLTSASPER